MKTKGSRNGIVFKGELVCNYCGKTYEVDRPGEMEFRRYCSKECTFKANTSKIKMIDVLEAPAYKRFHASTRGRAHPYKRKGSHVKIVLTEKEEAK